MKLLDERELLNCRRLPARVPIECAAVLLGFTAAELSLLLNSGLIRCLGRPAKNSRKWFSLVLVNKLGQDEDWLSRATAALNRATREKNLLTKSCRKPRSIAA